MTMCVACTCVLTRQTCSRGNLVQNWRTAQMPATCLLGQSGLPGVTAAAGPAVAACTYALLDQVLPADMTETQSGIPG